MKAAELDALKTMAVAKVAVAEIFIVAKVGSKNLCCRTDKKNNNDTTSAESFFDSQE